MTFPNLARRFATPAEHPHVDITVKAELEQAGIAAVSFRIGCLHGEVPTTVFGEAHQWGFERAWCYYRAKGPGIPSDVAEEFHKTWGRQCRVEGHCGCPSPREWRRGFAIGSYHIDTQEGLNAFVRLLASIELAALGTEEK